MSFLKISIELDTGHVRQLFFDLHGCRHMLSMSILVWSPWRKRVVVDINCCLISIEVDSGRQCLLLFGKKELFQGRIRYSTRASRKNVCGL